MFLERPPSWMRENEESDVASDKPIPARVCSYEIELKRLSFPFTLSLLSLSRTHKKPKRSRSSPDAVDPFFVGGSTFFRGRKKSKASERTPAFSEAALKRQQAHVGKKAFDGEKRSEKGKR